MKSKQILSQVIQVNPPRKLKKGDYAIFVSMDNITPHQKKISKFSQREVSGSKTTFKNGDTLLAKITPSLENGKTAFVDILKENEIGHGSTEFIVLSGKENQTLDLFVYYLMRTPEFREEVINSMTGTSGRQRVQETIFDYYEITLPSLLIQEKICSVLKDLDEKINNLQNQNKNLEQISQVIFKSWFVNFDGIIEFENSELGSIPKNWKVVKIEDVIELLYGKSLSEKNRKQGNVPVYGSSGIIGFHNEYLCSSSGIIVGRKGNVGSVFWSQNPFYAIDTTYYVKTELPLQYVYRNLQNQNFIDTDTSVPGLSRNQAYSLPILIPDESSLERFENIASKIQILFEKNNRTRSQLEQIRDTLLPKLMSGKIKV